MARLSIQLPEDLRSKLAARAAEAGHATVDQYVEALVRADVGVEEEFGAPGHLTVNNDSEVEALLLERLESTEPGIEATPEFWAKLRNEAAARRGAGTGR